MAKSWGGLLIGLNGSAVGWVSVGVGTDSQLDTTKSHPHEAAGCMQIVIGAVGESRYDMHA
jgi:hypothetical protein